MNWPFPSAAWPPNTADPATIHDLATDVGAPDRRPVAVDRVAGDALRGPDHFRVRGEVGVLVVALGEVEGPFLLHASGERPHQGFGRGERPRGKPKLAGRRVRPGRQTSRRCSDRLALVGHWLTVTPPRGIYRPRSTSVATHQRRGQRVRPYREARRYNSTALRAGVTQLAECLLPKHRLTSRPSPPDPPRAPSRPCHVLPRSTNVYTFNTRRGVWTLPRTPEAVDR